MHPENFAANVARIISLGSRIPALEALVAAAAELDLPCTALGDLLTATRADRAALVIEAEAIAAQLIGVGNEEPVPEAQV